MTDASKKVPFRVDFRGNVEIVATENFNKKFDRWVKYDREVITSALHDMLPAACERKYSII